MRKHGLCHRAMSVRPSVTFVYPVKMSNHILKLLSPSGSHTILVFFQTKRYGNIPTGTSLTGVEYRWGMAKIAILDQYLARIDDWWSAINNFDIDHSS